MVVIAFTWVDLSFRHRIRRRFRGMYSDVVEISNAQSLYVRQNPMS